MIFCCNFSLYKEGISGHTCTWIKDRTMDYQLRCWLYHLYMLLSHLLILNCSCLPKPSLSLESPPITANSTFDKSFLGLDKCNACIGTSICKKFFKEEIRFESWLSFHLKLPSNYQTYYLGSYTDDGKKWKPIIISRLLSQKQSVESDKRICDFGLKKDTCSIENILRGTDRVYKWMKADRLTPDLVRGLSSPMLWCPSQRLLDRIVRRYVEVLDAGSILMKHFTEKDKLRLLYTLSVNTHPIILQVFPGSEGWPFPKYIGSCGRTIVIASTQPIKTFYNSTPDVVADIAYQVLHITNFLRNNDFNYSLFYTHVHSDMFGLVKDGRVLVTDASTIGVLDKQGGQLMPNEFQPNKDVFTCLTSDCNTTLPTCSSIHDVQSLEMVCKHILPKLITNKFPVMMQQKIDTQLKICGNSSFSDHTILKSALTLLELLKQLRSCDTRFFYRYPECKYSDKY
ncbi:divergent protein kinase domain 2B isoform X1 [Protopterus annectens]|uniref:divergent protein kinase domain 2B isoform X1 n=1 Tax=Protopterus annectens TaxID=7888 RepID=UPI001CFA4F05|nr:divergent protein kinase domain 2B isoform X1 [Protopterus annectens]